MRWLRWRRRGPPTSPGSLPRRTCRRRLRRTGCRRPATSAHAFTLAHDSERDAFVAQLASLGHGTTLLVDTYDVERRGAGRGRGGRATPSARSGSTAATCPRSGSRCGRCSTRSARSRPGSSSPATSTSTRSPALAVAPVDGYGVGHLARHRVGGADRGARLQAGGAVRRAARGRRPGRAGRRCGRWRSGRSASRGAAGASGPCVSATRVGDGGDRADLAGAARGRRRPTASLLQELVQRRARSSGGSRSRPRGPGTPRCWPSFPRTRCSSLAGTRRSRPSSAPTARTPDG